MAVSSSALASLLRSMGTRIFLQNPGLFSLGSDCSMCSLRMFMLLFPSASVFIVLPHQDWAGDSVNNLWRLIQPKETTERRLVMATDHNKICLYQAGGSRDLV